MENEITLLPIGRNPNIKNEIMNSLSNCVTFRASIAFNTLTIDFWQNKLLKVLKKHDSFICFDINLPTDIEILEEMQKNTNSVFLFLYKLSTRSSDFNTEMPRSLLHTKIFMIDHKEGTSDIFIGSHNWTYTSILGPNMEGSIKIKTKQNSKIYKEVKSYLNWIKGCCTPYDLNLTDYYKMLQTNKDNSGKIIDIIEVIYNQEIPIGNNIGFWGTNLKDFNKLKTITRNIYIKNMGNKNEIELFEAEIINSGLLPSGYIMAPEVAFKVDLTSFHKSSEKIPEILKMNHPSEPDIDKSKFFATVRIKTKVNDAESLFPHTRKSLWKLSEDNPFILGMESENIKEAFGNTKFKILIPKSIDEIKEHLENDEKDSLIKKYVIIKKEKLISDEDDEE